MQVDSSNGVYQLGNRKKRWQSNGFLGFGEFWFFGGVFKMSGLRPY